MNLLGSSLSVAALAGLLASSTLAPTPAPRAAETYTVDNTHSAVVFHTRHLGISEAYGRFNTIADKSQVVLDADPAKSSILLVIDAQSVDTNAPDRDKHLRSGDFFNTKEFPEIVFESQKIKAADKGWEVTGDLSFHGVTKSVTAKAQPVGRGEMRGDQLAGFAAEFTIQLGDFGVEFVKQNPTALGPEVHLTVSLECKRK
ncbi:MAG: polyisoprenoid-binding protein [Planctomycetes bacterium]|nr:polyisoprenoid-binding protein [Planctomycetota bacterium]